MSEIGFLNEEQIAAYVDGLEHERAGYEARVKAAEVAGDDAAKIRYQNRIQQVDDEIERVKSLESVETPGDDADEAESKSDKKKSGKGDAS